MEDFNKIIESLKVKFVSARRFEVLSPLTVTNYYDLVNRLLLVKKGGMFFGPEKTAVSEGDLIFVPAGRSVNLFYGNEEGKLITNDELFSADEQYISFNPSDDSIDSAIAEIININLSSKVFESVNFFNSIDIPPFVIVQNEKINTLITNLYFESINSEDGRERILNSAAEITIIEILRYIQRNNLFIEQLVTNTAYFKDPRLINIFNYIKENLQGDLSNKVLANVANVSEDYVGQYFKMLTGINPQDYIEYQRMEQAITLLRTTKQSIRKIGIEVGYKDTAYFCRRFKMMFGIPAGKMRKRETLINA